MSDSGFRLDDSPEWPPRPSTRSERHKSLNLLDQRIDALLEARVPRRILTRVRVEDMIIITRALGTLIVLSTDEDDLAVLDLTEEQRGLLSEVRVEWFDV